VIVIGVGVNVILNGAVRWGVIRRRVIVDTSIIIVLMRAPVALAINSKVSLSLGLRTISS
jgi:hypothetical protein